MLDLTVHPRALSLTVANGPRATLVDVWSIDADGEARWLRSPPSPGRPAALAKCLFRLSDLEFTKWRGLIRKAADVTSIEETTHVIVGNTGCVARQPITLTVYQASAGSTFVVYDLDGTLKRTVK